VPTIIINGTINLFYESAISISVISNHSIFRALFGKIASVYFFVSKNIFIFQHLKISAGVEMSLVSAGRQQLMLIAGYAQEVSSRCNRTRTHVDHSLTCCSEENLKVLGRQKVVDGVQLYRHSSVPAR